MRIPPISVILAWPRPNYTNPETKGPGLMIIELVFLLMALTCLGLRMYVRLVMIRKTWWDDWLMVGALISMAAQTLFLFASGLSKLSILCSYLRIAAPGTWFSRLTWVTGILVFLLTWIFMIVLWTQCAPIWHYWTLFADWGNCIPEWPPLAGQGITTVMTDIAVYLLPMPTLFRLQMPMIQRISLAALFGLGLLVVIAGIMRTYWVLYVEITYVEDPSYDLTWDSYNIWIWTALEANFAIICGCAPAIRRLFTKGGNQSQFKLALPAHVNHLSHTNLDKFLKKELTDATSLQCLKALWNHLADVVDNKMALVPDSRSKAVRIDAQVLKFGKVLQRSDCFALVPVKEKLSPVDIDFESA
ncbi:Satratoxin biosynthesis SC1 cluster protein 4 [Colletotrichum sp. SAR 10_96]|nr:Satratoxin biosynthesis SC1 cluster protein 4 [Colletotrichum sp. SAR 10_96]